MGVSAAMARFSDPRILTGACLFILSDSLIAAGKFKMRIGYGESLVWITYYAAQLCITTGFLQEKLRGNGRGDTEPNSTPLSGADF